MLFDEAWAETESGVLGNFRKIRRVVSFYRNKITWVKMLARSQWNIFISRNFIVGFRCSTWSHGEIGSVNFQRSSW